tara:strand:- start:261 stop:959 length:699 start_codon:yes stop_codon:yes gene_type:complete
MKPFDLLLFESPYEYTEFYDVAHPKKELGKYDLDKSIIEEQQRRWLQIVEGFKQLAAICEEHHIPVRSSNQSADYLGMDDSLVRPHFTGCDYAAELSDEYLDALVKPGIRILISGGNFDYTGYTMLISPQDLEVRVKNTGIDPQEVENFYVRDNFGRIAVINGCVAARAAKLHLHLQGKPHEIYMDAATTKGDVPRPYTNSVYLFQKTLGSVKRRTIISAKRIDRRVLVPNS